MARKKNRNSLTTFIRTRKTTATPEMGPWEAEISFVRSIHSPCNRLPPRRRKGVVSTYNRPLFHPPDPHSRRCRRTVYSARCTWVLRWPILAGTWTCCPDSPGWCSSSRPSYPHSPSIRRSATASECTARCRTGIGRCDTPGTLQRFHSNQTISFIKVPDSRAQSCGINEKKFSQIKERNPLIANYQLNASGNAVTNAKPGGQHVKSVPKSTTGTTTSSPSWFIQIWNLI